MKYTVIGYYEDNNEPFVDWITAKNPISATRRVLKKRDPGIVVEVFAGHRKGILENEKTLNRVRFDNWMPILRFSARHHFH